MEKVRAWVMRDNLDAEKLVVVKANFKPKKAIDLAPIDPLTLKPERPEWLQVESVNGREIITVNQVKKDAELEDKLADEEAKKADEADKRDKFERAMNDLSKLRKKDIKDLESIRSILMDIKRVLTS